MDSKLALVIIVLISLATQHVDADMFYDRFLERAKEVTGQKLKCSPGATSVKMVIAKRTQLRESSESESQSDEALRTHMNSGIEEKKCLICVCSVDGTEEHCRGRPARNINECMRLEALKTGMDQGLPYDHDRILAYRIRRVGSANGSTQCTPYVSEYTDCSQENLCSGCTRCTCDKDGGWDCKKVIDCSADDDDDQGAVSLDVALDTLLAELNEKKKNRVLTPAPPKPNNDVVVGNAAFEDYFSLPPRLKRSVDSDSVSSDDHKNQKIKFYNTINAINKDTLKTTNVSGTVKAHKFKAEVAPKNARRTSSNQTTNETVHNSLHIEPTQHSEFDHSDADNKIEFSDEKKVLQNENIVGNYSQSKKDTEISKIVAKELKSGMEVLGKKGLNPVSNITFTPENDTVTAMAYVAGNLLNKLWEMEKYAGYGSIEADLLKHEKINDLLDLFKKPLSIKQETFLKQALEKLATSIDKNKNIENLTFCETFTIIDDNGTSSSNSESSEDSNFQFKIKSRESKQHLKRTDDKLNENVTSDILSKLKNVLIFLNDYENVQNHIEEIENKPAMLNSTKYEYTHLPSSDIIETLENLINKMFAMIMPNRYHKVRGDKKSNNNENDKRKYSQDMFHVMYNDPKITFKDRVILEYIKHMKSNPSCLFNNNLETDVQKSILKIEGNILNNISEFLKIKSFEDLMKILKERTTTESILQSTTTTAKSLLRSEPNNKISHGEKTNKMQHVKENLKKHLKAVIDNLIDIQSDDNNNELKNMNIIQALPCIYNLLNEGQPQSNKPLKTVEDPINNIKTLIDDLKSNAKTKSLTRRQHTSDASSPSVKVFQRVLKNMDNLLKQKSRRNLTPTKPKTVEQLKNMINKAKRTKSLFNNMTIFSNIAEKNQLMLLKALEAETKKNEIILSHIKTSIAAVTQLPSDELKDIQEFIETTNRNINLSHTILQNILRKTINAPIQTPKDADNKTHPTQKPDEAIPEYRKSNFQFTKDQIINQLIVNRVSAYMRRREASGRDLSNDIKYQVAENILSLLRAGNPELAKELFKFFIRNGDEEANYKKNERKPGQNRDTKAKRPHEEVLELPVDYEAPDATRSQAQEDYFKKFLL